MPPGNPITFEKTQLGKALFWDEQLSSTHTMACGGCHLPAKGGSDPRSIPGNPASVQPGPDTIFGNANDVIGSPGVIRSLPDGLFDRDLLFGLQPQETGRRRSGRST